MRIQPKIAFALLALAIAMPAARAQSQDQDDLPGRPSGFDRQAPSDDRGHDGRWQRSERDGERRGRGEDGWDEGGGRGMRGRGRHGRGFMLARLVNNPTIRERLGVTPEQAAKIRQQAADFRKSQIRSRADLEIKRLELRELLEADTPDRAAIDRKLQETSAARLAREKSAIDFHLAMRSALTPEQRKKLQEMRDEFRRGGRGGERGGERGERQGVRPHRPPQGAPPASKSPGDN